MFIVFTEYPGKKIMRKKYIPLTFTMKIATKKKKELKIEHKHSITTGFDDDVQINRPSITTKNSMDKLVSNTERKRIFLLKNR